MLSIYAPTKFHEFIQETIQKEERLDELIQIKDYLDYRPIPSGHNIMVKKDAIFPLLDWYNLLPPYLLPEEFELNAANLLGIVFAKLNNYEKVQSYLQEGNPTLYAELDFINRLQQGLPIDPETLPSSYSPFEEYRLMHNQAIIRHYAPNSDGDWDKVKYFYLEAIQAAPNEEYRAFSAKHFATLLIDLGDTADAQRLIQAILNSDISKEAKVELKQLICQVWMQELSVPYDEAMLQQLKDTLWEVLQTYEEQGRSREQALLLTDAGIIANYSESWSESLGYFNQALDIFDKEQLPEMSAHVHYRKGTLLFTWAQKGMPQFYRSAAESYQKAVKVFSKDVAPEIYAEIQHHLGIIYSEIPDEVKKKSIWAAVSSTAFAESLEFFTKESYPYDYASVCNHYANALTKYPEAKLSNNLDKALYYYQEALSIRTAKAYPLERCLTLFNYLEAQWNLGMPEDRFEEDRYEDMMAKAKEILVLTEDPKLIIEANQHLEKLAFLNQPIFRHKVKSMHEISLIRTVFNTLEDEFSKEELALMKAIDMKIGKLSNVEPLLMQNAFKAVTDAEEKYQSVQLNIEIIPIEIHCKDCNTNTIIENYKFACASCQKPNNNVVKGTELLIHRVHFHEVAESR